MILLSYLLAKEDLAVDRLALGFVAASDCVVRNDKNSLPAHFLPNTLMKDSSV
jgi:hypothetical protein